MALPQQIVESPQSGAHLATWTRCHTRRPSHRKPEIADAMTADSSLRPERLAAALIATRSSRRRRRGRGVTGVVFLLASAALLLSLAVMFLPLSHPRIAPEYGVERAIHHLHPAAIPLLG
jgi:hypothetical protein